MKKVLYYILPLLFVVGMGNVKAEVLSDTDIANLLKQNDQFKVIQTGNEYEYNINLLNEAFEDITDEERNFLNNYSSIVKYDNGVLSYVNNRDVSSYSDKEKVYAAMFDDLIFLDVANALTSKYLGEDYSILSFLNDLGKESDLANQLPIISDSKYGIKLDLGDKINYSQNSQSDGIDISEAFEVENINSFSINVDKLSNSLVELKKSFKPITIDNKVIVFYNISDEIKEYKYAYDCSGNLTLLILTKESGLYARNIDGFTQTTSMSGVLFDAQKVKNDSTDKISNLTKYDIADYYQKLNKQRGTCDNQNLAVKFENGKVKALEYSPADGFSLNLSIDVIEDGVKVTEETTTTEEVKNPKTGINVSYTFGIVFIIISSVSLFIVNKKKLFSK